MMSQLTLLFLGLFASEAGARAAPAIWNPKAPENGQLLARLNYASLESVLTAIGARHQRTGTDPARPTLLVTFANGRRATIALGSCDRAGSACKSLTIQTFWAKPGSGSRQRTALALATFNQRYALAKAFVAPDGRPALQRYLIADYGLIRGNLAVDLLNYADQAQRLVVEVLQPLERTPR